MEYFTARAMMIGMCQENEVNDLHEKEKRINRGLSPREFCLCFHKKPIKEYYGITDDDECQSRHAQRIEEDIFARNLLTTLSGERITQLKIEPLHQYDWAIFWKLNDLDLSYHGSKKLSGRLKDLMKLAPIIFSLGGLQYKLI